jgi:hypothetical protein
MLKFLQGFIGGTRAGVRDAAIRTIRDPAPREVSCGGADPFPIASRLITHNGFPILDGPKLWQWLEDSVPEAQRQAAWEKCELAWVLHFRDALGPQFRLDEGKTAMVLSSLPENVSKATIEYMQRTLKRVVAVLKGIAEVLPWGKDLLIVFDDGERYYQYVSYYYPEKGEFAFSAGMYIYRDSGHFVTIKDDLRIIEPTIAHEMTHGVLTHLPLPLWLNEGVAVNTERRLAGSGSRLHTPAQMRDKHRRFWSGRKIQEFWSGESFARTDDGNMLSYDLAQIIVEHLAKEWPSFKAFVLAADRNDGGAAAARTHLGVDLGALASALLERRSAADWTPDPSTWKPKPAEI